MGNSYSDIKEEFKDELIIINDIISKIITTNSFKNNEYNFLSKDVCDNYFIMFESKIKKHLKVHLNGLKEMLYIFPLKNDIDKKSVCNMVASHYIKIFYVLSIIKYVYDSEKGGDNNIGTIILKNTKLEGQTLYIKYCASEQKDYGNNTIDFKKLKGMELFLDSFLTKREGNHFMSIIKNILNLSYGEEDIVKLNAKTCNVYNELTGKKYKCNETIIDFDENYDTNVRVAMNNPIFNDSYCIDKKAVSVKYTNNIKKIYEKMINNYKLNISNVKKLLFEIIDVKNIKLKDFNSQELDVIIDKVKYTIMKFYVTSLTDYNNLLNEVFSKLKK